jgi:hypothetical protein
MIEVNHGRTKHGIVKQEALRHWNSSRTDALWELLRTSHVQAEDVRPSRLKTPNGPDTKSLDSRFLRDYQYAYSPRVSLGRCVSSPLVQFPAQQHVSRPLGHDADAGAAQYLDRQTRELLPVLGIPAT